MGLADLVLDEVQSKLKKWLRDPAEYEYVLEFAVEGEAARQIWIPDQVVSAIVEGIGNPERLPETLVNALLPVGKNIEITLRRVPQGNGTPDSVPFFGSLGGAMARWFLRSKLLQKGTS